MTLQAQIDAILADLFPGGFWYIQAPDSAGATREDYSVWSIVGGASFQTLEGDTDTSQPRIQVSIFSMDSAGLVSKVAAVDAAMKAANELFDTEPDNVAALLNYSSSVPVDGFEPETHRFYSHMDFYCWPSS